MLPLLFLARPVLSCVGGTAITVGKEIDRPACSSVCEVHRMPDLAPDQFEPPPSIARRRRNDVIDGFGDILGNNVEVALAHPLPPAKMSSATPSGPLALPRASRLNALRS